MNYEILKSLHIIFVVTWFAGLFYMPRLFVYFAESEFKSETEKNILQSQFKIMQRRLWFGITIPSSIVVLIFGGSLLHNFMPLQNHAWLKLKLLFVLGLYSYQYLLHCIFRQQQSGIISFSPMKLRIINEISTIFLFAIVFLVVVKDITKMVYGVFGLFGLIIALSLGIFAYRKIRKNNGEKV